MYPTYPVYFFLAYLLLFLLIPTVWVLGGVWKRAKSPRAVTCPGHGTAESISFDRWYAVRRRAAGEETEARVAGCTRWPEGQSCGRECLERIARL
ncbi:MAG TPA: hypothetical protein VMS37_15220 [Verrucomicrobiae bacterium]|nr:hypothetical protein [Verrucomicrobiae bacterium]